MNKNKGWLYKFRSRTLSLIVVLILASGFIGCGSSSNEVMASNATAKHVILIIGDGMQLEHERAYHN